MSIQGLHLTQIGKHDFLLEPSNSLDVTRQEILIESISTRLLAAKAACLFYDLSKQAIIDPVYYAWLKKLAEVTKIINVQMICVQIQPTAAFSLVQYIEGLPPFATALDISSWQNKSSATRS